MESNNEKLINVDGGVLTLKVLAEGLGENAETVARVLTAMNDEDLDFVVDTLLESEVETDVDRAVELFNTVLAQIEE